MAEVRVTDLLKVYDDLVAVRDLCITVADGEFVVFVGPSGCGKTTTLRCIAGLEIPNGGEISIGSEVVTKLPPSQRDIAFVFQQYALYPHMTVFENLAFPLKATKTSKEMIAERVGEVSKILHIEHLMKRRPGLLSGGEMQRVAIGRAMVRRPKLFLMDEPLTNLDAKLRTEMRAELKRLQSDLGATTIYVTHDQIEAMSMGDRVAVMNLGKILQYGTPGDVYNQPANMFVAGFIGSPAMNFLPCILTESEIDIGNDVKIVLNGFQYKNGVAGEKYVLGIRPEDALLSVGPTDGSVPCDVYVVEPLGSENIIDVHVAGKMLKCRTAPTFLPEVGKQLHVRLDLSRSHLFDVNTEEAIR